MILMKISENKTGISMTGETPLDETGSQKKGAYTVSISISPSLKHVSFGHK